MASVDTLERSSVEVAPKPPPRRQPSYQVVLWNDDDHSYEYVMEMLLAIFGFPFHKGYQLAREVDQTGRVICTVTTREHAELKQEQIHAYGKDVRVQLCAGSMSATIEPVPE